MKLRAVQDDFRDVFDELPDDPIKTAVEEAKKELKQDKLIGEHVKKKQIPKHYTAKHNIQILYRHAEFKQDLSKDCKEITKDIFICKF